MNGRERDLGLPQDLLEYANHNRNTHNPHFPKCLNKLMMFKLIFFPKTQVF